MKISAEIITQCSPYLDLKDILELHFVSKVIAQVARIQITPKLQQLVVNRLKVLLPDNYLILLDALQGEHIKRFRFCGGTFLSYMSAYRPLNLKDLDVYVEPISDIDFLHQISSIPNIVVSTEKTTGTPQEIHDIKINLPDNTTAVDLVFRHDVINCPSIDIWACQSGLVWANSHWIGEIYDYGHVRLQQLLIKTTLSDKRREKLVQKGYTIV